MAKLPKPPFPLPFPAPETTEEAIAQVVDFTEGIDETKPSGQSRFIVGLFASEHGLLHAARAARAAGHTNMQAWSPYPVHGLDPVLGLKRSLLGRPVFSISLVGFVLVFAGIYHLMVQDWAVIYGGKPYFTWQLWVVPTLEAGLLFGAVANLKLCFAACKLLPDPFTTLPDPRLTDDQFGLALSTATATAPDIEALLRAQGAHTVLATTPEIASGNPVFAPFVEPVPHAIRAHEGHAHA